MGHSQKTVVLDSVNVYSVLHFKAKASSIFFFYVPLTPCIENAPSSNNSPASDSQWTGRRSTDSHFSTYTADHARVSTCGKQNISFVILLCILFNKMFPLCVLKNVHACKGCWDGCSPGGRAGHLLIKRLEVQSGFSSLQPAWLVSSGKILSHKLVSDAFIDV